MLFWVLNFFNILRRVFIHLCIFNFGTFCWRFSFILWLFLSFNVLICFFIVKKLILSIFRSERLDSGFLLVFFPNFLKLSFNAFLKWVLFVVLIEIYDLLFFNFWLRVGFLSCIRSGSRIHIWNSIDIFKSDSLQNRFDTSNFWRNLFTFLLNFLNHLKNFNLELLLLRWITKEQRSFLRKSSIFLSLIIVWLQHILLHGIHHELIKHFWKVWLLASTAASAWETCELHVVVRNIWSLICFESTLLYVIGSLGTNYVSINFFVV